MLTRVILMSLALVAVALAYEYGYENAHRDPSEFCRGYPCPNYTVIEKTHDYELREYEEITWARTGGSDTVFGWWFDLFWYFHRSNSRYETIPMGIPIGNEYSFVNRRDLGEKTGLAFYTNEARPPQPNNPNIEIKNVPAGSKYYVRSFNEHATRDVISRELDALMTAIPDDASINRTVFYVGSYQPPLFLHFWDLHYEIVVMKN